MVPCYNEAASIGEVISKIPKEQLRALGFSVRILVVDNNSTDETSTIALRNGADVIHEKKQGKGYAVVTGFKHCAGSDIVVMLDGDGTYDAKEMLRLIEPIQNNFCDVVIGTRLAGKITQGSMKRFNRIGNWFFTFLVRNTYAENVTDVCTGYFAWNKEVVEQLSKYCESDGFNIEMEMIAKTAKMNYSIYSVPITYTDRAGKSSLHPVRDGVKIFHAWARNLTWKPQKGNVAMM